MYNAKFACTYDHMTLTLHVLLGWRVVCQGLLHDAVPAQVLPRGIVGDSGAAFVVVNGWVGPKGGHLGPTPKLHNTYLLQTLSVIASCSAYRYPADWSSLGQGIGPICCNRPERYADSQLQGDCDRGVHSSQMHDQYQQGDVRAWLVRSSYRASLYRGLVLHGLERVGYLQCAPIVRALPYQQSKVALQVKQGQAPTFRPSVTALPTSFGDAESPTASPILGSLPVEMEESRLLIASPTSARRSTCKHSSGPLSRCLQNEELPR